MSRLIPAVLMLLVGAMVVAGPQIAMGPSYAGDEGKERTRAKIQDHSRVIEPRIELITKQYLLDDYTEAAGGATGYEPQ